MVTTFVVFNSSCERYNGRRLNPLAVTTFPECSCSAIVCVIQSSTTGYTAANSSGVIAETPVAGEKADAVAIPSHKPIAIVLDFMNPRRPPRRLWGVLWQASAKKPQEGDIIIIAAELLFILRAELQSIDVFLNHAQMDPESLQVDFEWACDLE